MPCPYKKLCVYFHLKFIYNLQKLIYTLYYNQANAHIFYVGIDTVTRRVCQKCGAFGTNDLFRALLKYTITPHLQKESTIGRTIILAPVPISISHNENSPEISSQVPDPGEKVRTAV